MPIEILPYKPSWPLEFQDFAQELKAALGATALAIHHIGSTSVPGLAAKDIIDIQVSVASFDAILLEKFKSLDLLYREDIQNDHCPPGMVLKPGELEKRYFQQVQRPINIHVRSEGRFNQRYALLCRDYLRTHSMAANAYAEIKQQLAHYFPDDAEAYYAIKDPVFDVVMAAACEWSELSNWKPADSDA